MRSPSYRIVLQCLRLVGEAAWLFAWSEVLGHWLNPKYGPALPLWLLSVALVLAAALSHAVVRPAAGAWVRFAVSLLGVAVSAGAGLLSAALAFGPLDPGRLGSTIAGTWAFVAGCLALVTWWRGSRLGTSRPSLYEIEGQFRFGIFALAGLFALVAAIGVGSAPGPVSLVEPALALVASGLLGMPLARISEVSAERQSELPRLQPSGPWLGTLVGVVGGLLLVTLLLAGVVTAERLGVVIGLVLDALDRVLVAIVMAIAIPVSYLVAWLIDFLRARLTHQPVKPTVTKLPALNQLAKQAANSGKMPPELLMIVNVVLVTGIVLVIVVLLARAIARRTRWEREPDGVEELRESVFGWETIRELIAWLLGRFRRPRAVVTAPAVDPDPVDPRSVREVYREFLRLTMRLGFPRAHAETPLEYARRIERDRLSGRNGEASEEPDVRGDLDTLTSTYVRVRYGPPTSPPAEASLAARALERLRALWTRS